MEESERQKLWIATARDMGFREGLEAAAKVVEGNANVPWCVVPGHPGLVDDIAAAIRSLIPKD